MATKRRKQPKKGTLVRGPDGVLYFVPDSKLRAFHVPEKGEARVRAELEEWIKSRETKGKVTAVRGRMVGIGIDVPIGIDTPIGIDMGRKTRGRLKPRSK